MALLFKRNYPARNSDIPHRTMKCRRLTLSEHEKMGQMLVDIQDRLALIYREIYELSYEMPDVRTLKTIMKAQSTAINLSQALSKLQSVLRNQLSEDFPDYNKYWIYWWKNSGKK